MKKSIIFILIFLYFFVLNFPVSFASYISPENRSIQINARHAIVLDRFSKQKLFGKNENEKCKMASTTKIMTAIVVLENANLNEFVNISSNAARTGGSRLGLSENDTITVENLLYGLMLKSGNDAAVALAEHVGHNLENFALMMNKKAKELKLYSTNFVTPHGLDNDNHYTTAYDLSILTDYALKNSSFSKIVNTQSYTIILNGYPKDIKNTNELLGNFDGIYGVKTGFTNGANRCLVTSCKKNNLDVICVVLGCDTKKDRTHDSITLLNYIFDNFTLVNVKDIIFKNFEIWKQQHSNSFLVNKGFSNSLELSLKKSDFKFSKIAVKKTSIDSIATDISFSSYFTAPLVPNTKIGSVNLSINTTPYYSVEILNTNEIKRKSPWIYILYIFKNYSCFFS